MLSPERAWKMLLQIPNSPFRGIKLMDFRQVVYGQALSLSAGAGQTSGNVAQNFQGGAIILGVTSNCYVSGAAAATGQSNNNRQLYGLNFAYTNNEVLTPGGPILAEALLGGGEDTLFPARPLVVAQNQSILAAATNYTSTAIIVHVAYHCLVARTAV